ncbi:flagellar hook-basal body complex protein FliE [Proteiniborus ethanoligenes]|uniref:Flagellar hook-basal body complex protein FliE n=1 Tax=Proteiniborus ethanoligenes TaxID=415015 RepID=A0A1H3PNF2_9FIRM|nr:flagellar hook-basal body complex protein FliE [Proteiniborus ethanoligenes]TAH63828.1 MAG: flagellar hook-basal body complex protein FliE [Gottschalkiaceae bacterium]SDZ02684.1 flagellar hook-basal body complex protein FliE [Proteiniborus ethanoligenes]
MRIENLSKPLEIKGSINKNQMDNLDMKTSFNDLLKNALNEVNKLQTEADDHNKLLAIGQVDNIHDVTIASEKAKIALQMTLAIRNKVVDAYKEIMRMQV